VLEIEKIECSTFFLIKIELKPSSDYFDYKNNKIEKENNRLFE